MSSNVQVVPVTVAVPTRAPSRSTCKVSPAFSSAEIVPLSKGEVSLVDPSLATEPVTGAWLSVTSSMVVVWVMVEVSTLKRMEFDSALVLPARSTTMAV